MKISELKRRSIAKAVCILALSTNFITAGCAIAAPMDSLVERDVSSGPPTVENLVDVARKYTGIPSLEIVDIVKRPRRYKIDGGCFGHDTFFEGWTVKVSQGKTLVAYRSENGWCVKDEPPPLFHTDKYGKIELDIEPRMPGSLELVEEPGPVVKQATPIKTKKVPIVSPKTTSTNHKPHPAQAKIEPHGQSEPIKFTTRED